MMRIYTLTLLFLLGTFLAHSQDGALPNRIIFQIAKGGSPEKAFGKFQGRTPSYECLSQSLNIWLADFGGVGMDIKGIILWLKTQDGVLEAQADFVLEQRALPNDTELGQQWHLVNTGQNGGLPGADIHAAGAWNTTTGGLTVTGDSIVVCVMDSGFDTQHPDLIPNIWKNKEEVPNNGVDDDGNGFIDDVNGWNLQTLNDNVYSNASSHGTLVAGIIGAKGNNNIGVVGVNWNVKLMLVKFTNLTVSTAISAYDYAYVMRKRYNETNGASGAYVVATNASWGFAGQTAAAAPIWCSFFDSLGTQGVLNVVAAPNGNTNIEIAGDLPSVCSSPYIISVTSTTNRDLKVSGSGYGPNTVDIAAPGLNIFSTSVGNYGQSSGTSFATPQISGGVALLYAGNCAGLSTLAKTRPDSSALLVKRALMNGVDILSDLQGITVSEGRLNLENSLVQLSGSCPTAPICTAPINLRIDLATGNSVTLNWDNPGIDHEMRYRALGSTAWTYLLASHPSNISGLLPCTEYEFEVRKICGIDASIFSNRIRQRTANCCPQPINIGVTISLDTVASISWVDTGPVTNYELRYKLVDEQNWTNVGNLMGNSHQLTGLSSCQSYQIQVQSLCNGINNLPFSNSLIFQTGGCGACSSSSYCSSSGVSTANEWIDTIWVGQQFVATGNDGGYYFGGYKGMSLMRGSTFPLRFVQAYTSTAYNEVYRAWIDFDQNGAFDSGELIASSSASNQPYVGSFSVPTTALLGMTRMRVSMRWSFAPASCGSIPFGEVEDYCVYVSDTLDNVLETGELALRIYPNPATGMAYLDLGGNAFDDSNLEMLNSIGQKVETLLISPIHENLWSVSLKGLSSGLYYLRGITPQGKRILGRLMVME